MALVFFEGGRQDGKTELIEGLGDGDLVYGDIGSPSADHYRRTAGPRTVQTADGEAEVYVCIERGQIGSVAEDYEPQ